MFEINHIVNLIVALLYIFFMCGGCASRGGSPGNSFLKHNTDYQNGVKGIYIIETVKGQEVKFVGYSDKQKASLLKLKKQKILSRQTYPVSDFVEFSSQKKTPVTILNEGEGLLLNSIKKRD